MTEVPPLQSDQSKSLTAWDTYEVPPRQRNETMTIPPKCAHFVSPVCTNKRRTLWTHPLCSSIFFSTLSIYATCIINNLYLDIIPVTQPWFVFFFSTSLFMFANTHIAVSFLFITSNGCREAGLYIAFVYTSTLCLLCFVGFVVLLFLLSSLVMSTFAYKRRILILGGQRPFMRWSVRACVSIFV